MTASINSTPRRTSLQTRVCVVFWVLAAIITALALYPRLTLPEPAATEGTMQYYNHVLAFSTLIIVGAVGWGLQRRLIGCVAIGAIALELAQTFSPGRETALADLLASLAGVVIGCAVAYLAGLVLRRTDIRAAPLEPKTQDP
jgi:hypothetical protein